MLTGSLRSRVNVRALCLATVVGLALWPSVLLADIEIRVKNTWVERYRLRATISTQFRVVKTHHKAKTATEDGDIHCAGAPDAEVGFVTVAEIMNAKDSPESISQLVQAEGAEDPVAMTGVWRLWPEHADGGEAFEQNAFDENEIVSTNPAHVFEIHPVTEINGIDVRATFGPIDGFTYKKAAAAFAEYNNKACRIVKGHKYTSIFTKKTGYNYVRFKVLLLEKPTKLLGSTPTNESKADGIAFFGNAIDPEAEDEEDRVLTGKVRFIIVKGTSAYDEIKSMKAGDEVLVVGIPRINLSLVKWRADNAKTRPGVAERTLPYEIVIVGVLSESD